jgi:hypothetical protein
MSGSVHGLPFGNIHTNGGVTVNPADYVPCGERQVGTCGVDKQADELLSVTLHNTILHRVRNYPVPMRTPLYIDQRVLGQQRNSLTNVQAAIYS